jgi:D-sedoheptulose 7-phosphate isomerase
MKNPAHRTPGEILDGFVTECHRVQAQFFAEYRQQILDVAETIARTFEIGGKVLFFGNGGSAADAQHFAAELVGRFIPERPALPAMSLSTDTSVLTSLGNDYGFDRIFSRQIEAHGNEGDAAVAISTSGNSANVLEGIAAAKKGGLYTIGLTGANGGRMKGEVDVLFRVPSTETPRIQETHILLGHSLCEIVDRRLFPGAYRD